jgi:ATP-dependent DNA helicase RecQ
MRERALQLLRTAVGSARAQFHPGQWEAIEAIVVRRERLLVVQRTGWGKSIVYFIAAKLLREQSSGCALLISPLLALMRNQIEAARRIGVLFSLGPRLPSGLPADRPNSPIPAAKPARTGYDRNGK